ncbi:TonB-dependent receptor plug domain-containing protein [Mangrovibacterium sp.]|uniref:TonB-dependent receptor plug domain-containing protein n=1 Tax=Mangrovibacterium sp. TaxID=1961364 RepID=UPI0035628C4B
MKTIRTINSRIANTVIKLVLLVFALIPQTKIFAQQAATIDGRVTEEEFNEPLEKAIVQIKGTSIYTVTNRFGYFSMLLPSAFFELEAIHPDIFSEFYNVSTYEGILTPIGAVRLEPVAVGRLAQRDIAARVNIAQHPAATRNTPVIDLLNQSGGTDFNQLFVGQPSVYLLENGGGYGSSEISLRGFSANQNQVVFNGVSLNNPETGRMNSSLYPGLNDWAQHVQFTAGMASGKQSELGQTGLINVLPFMPNKKSGVRLLSSTGVNGYLKTAATIHSGVSKRNLAFSLKLDRTAGDGVPDFTGFESYGLYFNLHKEISHMHSILFTSVLKSWQADLRNRPDSVARTSLYGIDYNSEWGLLDNKELGWNGSFGLANLSVLTHHWHLRVNTKLVSQLYAELENSAQTYPGGYMNGMLPDQLPRDRGLIDYDTIAIYNANRVISENDGISILAAANRTTRFGLQSQLIHEFDKNTQFYMAADLEQYTADHFGAVNNLLGADEFLSEADLNGNSEAVQNFLESSFLPKTGSAEPVDYHYKSQIRKAGFSIKAQKTGNHAFGYAEGAFYIKSLQREDYYSYLNSDSQQKTDWINQVGWRVQSGITYRLNSIHSLQLNGGASSSPVRFDVLFPAENNWENTAAKNQNLFSGEMAYVLSSGRFFLSLRGYAMYQQNRTDIQRLMLNEDESLAVLSGINQFHRGVEFSGQMKYFKRFNLYVNASYGEWTLDNSVLAQTYDTNNQLVSETNLPFSGYQTDNAAPKSIYIKNEFNFYKGLEINLNYYRSFGTYAPMMVHDFDQTETPEQIKLPAFDKLGAGLNYYHQFRKKWTINIFAEVQNILGSQYINQLFTNESEVGMFRSNMALYGKNTSWRAGLSLNF